jgi:hypothetical protein
MKAGPAALRETLLNPRANAAAARSAATARQAARAAGDATPEKLVVE